MHSFGKSDLIQMLSENVAAVSKIFHEYFRDRAVTFYNLLYV
jgi:hypothetical protein